MIRSILKRNRLVETEKVQFLSRFGTFFEEFRSGGLFYYLYYAFFFLKRIGIMISVMFIKESILQLTLTLILCLIVNNI